MVGQKHELFFIAYLSSKWQREEVGNIEISTRDMPEKKKTEKWHYKFNPEDYIVAGIVTPSGIEDTHFCI